MKQKDPIMHWDEESGTATVILYDRDNAFVGIATCHPDDMDMKSEMTGMEIAHSRALINAYKHFRDTEVIPAIKALRHIIGCYANGEKYDLKSNEAFLIKRQLQDYETDLEVIREAIKAQKMALHKYLKDKETFYNRVRNNRKQGQK